MTDLEAQIESQKQLIDSFKSGTAYKLSKGVDYFPVAPQKFELMGHRAPLTLVLFHPTFNLLASASEDASIRIWDFESGQMESSLRGHTNSVQHLSFDKSGALLGSQFFIPYPPPFFFFFFFKNLFIHPFLQLLAPPISQLNFGTCKLMNV